MVTQTSSDSGSINGLRKHGAPDFGFLPLNEVQRKILEALDEIRPARYDFNKLCTRLKDVSQHIIFKELDYLGGKGLVEIERINAPPYNEGFVKITSDGVDYLFGKESTVSRKTFVQEIHAQKISNVIQGETVNITNVDVYNQIMNEVEKIKDVEKKSFLKTLADQAKDNAPLLQTILEGIKIFTNG